MLPGFRFLFAATMLSVSLLVFGLGAASLFRAAHQAFAINPSWRGGADVTFAQKGEAGPPMLAALRVDPPRLDKAQNEVAVAPPTVPPPEPAPLDAEPAPARVAALRPADAHAAEIADTDGEKPEMAAAQSPPATETASRPAADIAAKSDQTKTAAPAAPDASPDKSEPAIALVEPSPTKPGPPPTDPAATPEASSKPANIATLGDAPVGVVQDNPGNEKAATADSATADQNAIKKLRARRAAYRRRLAARLRLAAQQFLLQQQADPFTQPFPPLTPIITPAPTKRHRAREITPRP